MATLEELIKQCKFYRDGEWLADIDRYSDRDEKYMYILCHTGEYLWIEEIRDPSEEFKWKREFVEKIKGFEDIPIDLRVGIVLSIYHYVKDPAYENDDLLKRLYVEAMSFYTGSHSISHS